MATLLLRIVTLEKTAYSGEAERVSIPTSEGIITVLPGHEPLIGLVAPGTLVVRMSGGARESFIVTSGFFEVRPSREIVIMADSADRVGDIDIDAVRRSKAQAEAELGSGTDLNELEVAHLEDVLAREIARLDVADRHLGGGSRGL